MTGEIIAVALGLLVGLSLGALGGGGSRCPAAAPIRPPMRCPACDHRFSLREASRIYNPFRIHCPECKMVLSAGSSFGRMLLVSLGTGCWLAAVTVSYRDFRYVINYIVQIWMYLTPVIYPITFIPEKWQWLMYLNPMYGWIDGIRACFLGKEIDQIGLLVSVTFSITIAIIGFAYFSRAERRFADVI